MVADALSRKAELAALQAPDPVVARVQSTLLDRIREGMKHDPAAQNLTTGKTRRFWLRDGLLLVKGERIFVPRWDSLRRDLVKECHDTKWAGHPGQHRILALLERAYYWPQMRNDVEEYVRTCLVCQQDKPSHLKPGGSNEPLPIPSRPWRASPWTSSWPYPRSMGTVPSWW
jgi:hypothetical protein